MRCLIMTDLDKIKIYDILITLLFISFIIVTFIKIEELEKAIENQYNINEYIFDRIEAVHYND